MNPSQTPVGIVIPVYNRVDTLSRTLASLEAQTIAPGKLTVVVADDGSEEDVAGLVEDWRPPFRKHYVRQEHLGFGAARARNLGASVLDGGIIIFLDSDSLVRPDFVARHSNWFADTTSARVVIGGRHHLEGRDLSLERLRSGTAELSAAQDRESDDFRSVLSRRTSGYSHTDEGYRAFVSSNVSLPHALHMEVGGFDPRFRWWGSEDTEYGWRLWQAGAEFVDDSDNAIYHQLDTDTAGGAEGRQRARELNRGLLVSLIPQRFYRKGMPDPPPEVPKVSVVVHDVPEGAPEELWHELRSQTLPDFEVIFVAEPDSHDPFAGAAEGERRISFASDLGEAISMSRGEYVALIAGASTPSRTLIQNITKRLDRRPAAIGLTFGVQVTGAGEFGLRGDVEHLEQSWDYAYPIALASRRRWLAQQLNRGIDLLDALTRLRRDAMHTRQTLVELPSVDRSPRPQRFTFGGTGMKQIWEEAQLGPAQAMRAGLRAVKERVRPGKTGSTEPASTPSSSRPGIRYVGWVGKDNLGDEAMLQATEALMPWGDVEVRGEARDLLLLGGGTLINRNQYLGWLTDRDSPRLERAVLGTGVASPGYWGITEDPEEWKRWFDSCAYIGVRGPKSLETLEEWGISRDVEIVGDPALALQPADVDVEGSRILIAPAWTDGQLWGESDDRVYDALAGAAATWIDSGREVTLLSCHPSDDRPILLIRERLGNRPSDYVAGYLDVTVSLAVIASSALVVGERLHACVLAAAAGRPFVGLEYRPKVLDFAASVGMETHAVRTDVVSAGLLREHASALDGPREEMLQQVETYRSRLQAASAIIRSALDA